MKLDINGTQIHVIQQGLGPVALIFLHYYGGSVRTWSSVMNILSPQYRTLAMDHRGWGDSDKPEEGYHLANLAADVEGVITRLGLQRYILVGHSMGGKVAQLVASHRPQGLEGLILVAPSPPVPMRLSGEERTVLKSAYLCRESVNDVIDHVLTAKKLSTWLREQVIVDSLKGSPQAKKAWPDDVMNEDITTAVTAIRVPVKVVIGEKDQVERISVLKAELLPRIPQADLHIIPDAGHLLPLEAPEELARVIGGFIAAVTGTTAA